MNVRRSCTFVASLFLVCATPASAQSGPPPVKIDPQISAMVAAVSPDDLRALDTKLVSFGTRNVFSERLRSPQRGVYAARDWIRSQFETIGANSGGRLSVTYDTYVQAKTARTPRPVQVSSVIATLRGDDPSGPLYVMSSHYDSRNSDGNDSVLDAPGADDNGSGTIAVIEAAKAMAASHFRGTIVFACFDGEEQGLFGSDHYAKVLKAAGTRVAANLNNDIMGSSTGHDGQRAPDVVRLFSETSDSTSRELARFVQEQSEAYVPSMTAELIYRSDRFLRGGDQQSFQGQGFPAVRFVEKYENYDHQHQNIRVENDIQYGDLLQYVDFNYVARVASMNVAALAALALGPDEPHNVQMLTKTLGYDTSLRWKPAAGATSYEVVWRETSAPQWQRAQDVGNVTQATVNVSKDDYVLGLRSVDAAGHRSPAVSPVPVKE